MEKSNLEQLEREISEKYINIINSNTQKQLNHGETNFQGKILKLLKNKLKFSYC